MILSIMPFMEQLNHIPGRELRPKRPSAPSLSPTAAKNACLSAPHPGPVLNRAIVNNIISFSLSRYSGEMTVGIGSCSLKPILNINKTAAPDIRHGRFIYIENHSMRLSSSRVLPNSSRLRLSTALSERSTPASFKSSIGAPLPPLERNFR